MKIACLGNMNNIIAPTAQMLASQGHEVDLFLLFEYDHFHPEADYFDAGEIKFGLKKLDWDWEKISEIPAAEIRKTFAGYAFFIGTDYAPAILAKAGIKLDVFCWAGTDLFDWPFYQPVYRVPHLWQTRNMSTAKLQFEGIRNADYLPMSPNNTFIDDVLKRINTKARKVSALPFLNYGLLNDAYFEHSSFAGMLKALRQENDLLIVQHSRQWWITAPAEFDKGNDRFLRGVKLFKEKNPDVKLKLLLLEYGTDVEESKKLVGVLGLEKNVQWIPKSLRRDLLGLIKLCDLGVAETGDESWFLYCVNAEIMACAVPLIGYRNDSNYAGMELFDLLNANSAEGILAALEEYWQHKEKWKTAAAENREWLLKFNNENPQIWLAEAIRKKSSRHLSPGSKLRLNFFEKKMQAYRFINKAVMASKSAWLKEKILDAKINS